MLLILGRLWALVLDCSQYQGLIDFDELGRSWQFGYWFGLHKVIILKATEGNGFEDPCFERNAAAARAHGWLVVAYHFARPDASADDGAREAEFVTNLARSRGCVCVALDLEEAGALTGAQVGAWRDQFVLHLFGLWQAPHGLYEGGYMTGSDRMPIPADPRVAALVWLWVPNYAQFGYTPDPDPRTLRSLAAMPPGFSQLAMQQYTSTAHVPGVGGSSVDCSIASAEWLAAIEGTGVPAPPPPPQELTMADVNTIIAQVDKDHQDTRAYMPPLAVKKDDSPVQWLILTGGAELAKQWLPGPAKSVMQETRQVSSLLKDAGHDYVELIDPAEKAWLDALPVVGPTFDHVQS